MPFMSSTPSCTLHGAMAVAEHTHIGVHADECGLDDAIERDAVDDVRAGTADADDADAGRAGLQRECLWPG
jgi:hypothetical protein